MFRFDEGLKVYLHRASVDYNEMGPHGSCQRIPLSKFTGLYRQRTGDAAQTTSTTTEIN